MTFPPKFQDGSRAFRPSQVLRIDERRVTGFDAAPTTLRNGIDVSRQTMVLLSVGAIAPAIAPAGWDVEIVVWRMKTEPSTTLNPSGQWYAREVDTFSLEPALIVNGEPQEMAYPTLNSEQMFFQVRAMGVTPDTWEIDLFVSELGRRTDEAQDNCCPATGATEVSIDLDLAVHDEPVIATGIHPMLEAKNIDGAALPNGVAEGDACRAAASLAGIAYTNIATENGHNTAVQAVDTEIDINDGDNAVVMAGAEAETYNGLAMEEIADTDGDSTRIKASRYGIQYTMPMTQNGGATAIVPDETTPSAAAGGLANLMMGAVARAVQDAALGNTESTHLVTNLYRELITAAFDWASQADRTEEQDPLDTRHVSDTLAATNIDANTVFDFYLDMDGYKDLTIQLATWTPGGGTIAIEVEFSNENNGTAPAACTYDNVSLRRYGATPILAAVGYAESIGDAAAGTPNPAVPPINTKFAHIEVTIASDPTDAAFEIFVRRRW